MSDYIYAMGYIFLVIEKTQVKRIFFINEQIEKSMFSKELCP